MGCGERRCRMVALSGAFLDAVSLFRDAGSRIGEGKKAAGLVFFLLSIRLYLFRKIDVTGGSRTLPVVTQQSRLRIKFPEHPSPPLDFRPRFAFLANRRKQKENRR